METLCLASFLQMNASPMHNLFKFLIIPFTSRGFRISSQPDPNLFHSIEFLISSKTLFNPSGIVGPILLFLSEPSQFRVCSQHQLPPRSHVDLYLIQLQINMNQLFNSISAQIQFLTVLYSLLKLATVCLVFNISSKSL